MVTARSINARLPRTTRTNRIIKWKIIIKLLQLIKIQTNKQHLQPQRWPHLQDQHRTNLNGSATFKPTTVHMNAHMYWPGTRRNEGGDLKSEFPLHVECGPLFKHLPNRINLPKRIESIFFFSSFNREQWSFFKSAQVFKRIYRSHKSHTFMHLYVRSFYEARLG